MRTRRIVLAELATVNPPRRVPRVRKHRPIFAMRVPSGSHHTRRAAANRTRAYQIHFASGSASFAERSIVANTESTPVTR